MSLIKKADVKNHLSARHRTEIHLQAESQATATGSPHEDNSNDDLKETDSVEYSLRIPNPGSSETAATVTASKPHLSVVSRQSKSVPA